MLYKYESLRNTVFYGWKLSKQMVNQSGVALVSSQRDPCIFHVRLSLFILPTWTGSVHAHYKSRWLQEVSNQKQEKQSGRKSFHITCVKVVAHFVRQARQVKKCHPDIYFDLFFLGFRCYDLGRESGAETSRKTTGVNTTWMHSLTPNLGRKAQTEKNS